MVFWMELELISCVFVDFFRTTSVSMERMSRDFTLFVLCCATFFFFYGTGFFGRFYNIIIKKRSHELWCLRLSIQIVTSSLYLSSNFRLSTVAGIRTMTLHGISSPPCLLGERRLCVDINCASISAPLLSKYFVVRLISCARWPTARGSWL